MGTYDPMPNDNDGSANGTPWGNWLRGAIGGLDGRALVLERSSINTQTGTSYTLVLGDEGKTVARSNASANTTTVPPNSSVAFAVGTKLTVRQTGVGSSSIVAGSGVTLQSRNSALTLAGQYGAAVLEKNGTDSWWVDGDLI